MKRRAVLAVALAVLALLAAAKLLTLDAVREHRPGLLAVLDVVEPWKSSLARGDERFAAGDLAAATEQFRQGVDRAPDDGSRCLVRVNLALTRFRRADLLLTSGDVARAVPFLRQAASTADARSGDRCARADDDTLSAIAEAARDDLVRTQLPDPPATGTEPAAAPPAGAPAQDALDDVAQEAQQGAVDRGAQADQDRSTSGDFSVSSTPW